MQRYYFFKEDFDILTKKIDDICKKIREIGKDMGASCNEGAETFHDNFVYEQGERQQHMWSHRLHELVRIKNNAKVISNDTKNDKVRIGRKIIIKDLEKDQIKKLQIGSYMILQNDVDGDYNIISYNSPLAQLIIGSEKGDTRTGKIGNEIKSFLIVEID